MIVVFFFLHNDLHTKLLLLAWPKMLVSINKEETFFSLRDARNNALYFIFS